ncbi:NTP transferase domain-containing protein [Janibacter corallicola]|uniref:NTP transferase domain-containing protein n=1 Tax=Janibacter corallicola TaxID=415212 RepID=UPI00082E35F3|nr:NTP transferase domain-containing protein [Janibacter corallicola]
MSIPDFDAVVLAGGAGQRLGGISKPDVELAGRRLVDGVLVAVSDAREIVVVGDVEVPKGVHRTLEDPPYGGPAAGVAAGLDELARVGGPAPWTVLLACDLADPVPALGRLVAAWAHAQSSPDVASEEHDGWCLEDSGGSPQWLFGIHRTDSLRTALTRLGDPRDRSMRSLFAESTLVTMAAGDDDVADIDTWGDHARWSERLAQERWADWIEDASEAVGIDPESVDVPGIQTLARQVAHDFERPMAPVGAYILGVAVGRLEEQGRPIDKESLRQAIAATARDQPRKDDH